MIWSPCISTLYEHESDDSDSQLPCSGSGLGQLDLATDMTRQTGDEELSPLAGLICLSAQLDDSAPSLRTAKSALVTQLRGRTPGILREAIHGSLCKVSSTSSTHELRQT